MFVRELPGCQFTQILLGRQTTLKNRSCYQSKRHVQFHGIDYRPFPRSFLSGRVEYLVQQVTTGLIFMTQNVRCNLNQVATKLPLVPMSKNISHFLIIQVQQPFHYPICFGNELHITIFDTIMDHLHKMAGTCRTDPITTRRTVRCLCSYALQNRFYLLPCRHGTSRHDRSTIQGTFFSPRDTTTDEKETFRFGHCYATVGIFKVRVTTVNQNITRRKVREKLFH